MKKFLSIFLSVLFLCSFSITAYAADGAPDDVVIEAEDGLVASEEETADPYTTGLINSYYVNISKYNTKYLKISMMTDATSTYYKVGVKNITVQRYVNGSWKDYEDLDDQFMYNTSCYAGYIYSSALPSGYSYRVTATHYVKKSSSLFSSTQSIDCTSTLVTISY